MEQPPDRILVEALVRSGAPETIPFQLRDVPLPGSDPAPGGDSSAVAVSPADHPDLVPQGGARVRFSVRLQGRPAGRGTLAVGLSAAGTTAPAPWRWLTLGTDAAGTALLPNLRPGRYRAALRWIPADGAASLPPGGRWLHNLIEFNATTASLSELPALEWE
jgi:hypothetical protein